ncbi:Ctr copper transporter family-domain-containing protein [Lipomyces arxii]|uniref:Ctr copper transporter family-domain-containing protein n=1 Tax=Lipomyces arxii TaxID=56418 RepID=UPI0034CD8836
MDHSAHMGEDHASMDHSQHMDGMNSMNQLDSKLGDFVGSPEGTASRSCNLHMLFTWNTKDLCIVFDWWHITTTFGLIVSLAVIFAVAGGYEYLRMLTSPRASLDILPKREDHATTQAVKSRSKAKMAAFYAIQVFYSFFLMLVFMTYNGWVMLSVVAGAFSGHYFFSGRDSESRGMFCH